jgi:hypothetical protein
VKLLIVGYVRATYIWILEILALCSSRVDQSVGALYQLQRRLYVLSDIRKLRDRPKSVGLTRRRGRETYTAYQRMIASDDINSIHTRRV